MFFCLDVNILHHYYNSSCVAMVSITFREHIPALLIIFPNSFVKIVPYILSG